MKEVTEERKVLDILYEAVDGTRFNSKEECLRYEESAKGVLKARLMKLVDYSDSENNILGSSDNNTLYGVRLKEEKDKDVILQLYLLDHPHLLKEKDNKWVNRAKDLIEFAYKEKDILLVGEGYEGDFFIVDCCKNIVDRLYNRVNYGLEQ